MPRCYVPAADAAGTHLILPEAEAHHVSRVLRLPPGATVVVFDGRGHEWDARIATVSRTDVTVDLGDPRIPIAEPAVVVTLAIGLLKRDQMDDVVRDATALGVTRIVPMVTDHVAVPARAWSRDGLEERWHRIAVAAAKQCGRAVVPEIASVKPVVAVLRETAATRVLCVEPQHARPGLAPIDAAPAGVLLCVGPEGGWSAGELALADELHARRWTLGPRTLRAELAPVVALATLWARLGSEGD